MKTSLSRVAPSGYTDAEQRQATDRYLRELTGKGVYVVRADDPRFERLLVDMAGAECARVYGMARR